MHKTDFKGIYAVLSQICKCINNTFLVDRSSFKDKWKVSSFGLFSVKLDANQAGVGLTVNEDICPSWTHSLPLYTSFHQVSRQSVLGTVCCTSWTHSLVPSNSTLACTSAKCLARCFEHGVLHSVLHGVLHSVLRGVLHTVQCTVCFGHGVLHGVQESSARQFITIS